MKITAGLVAAAALCVVVTQSKTIDGFDTTYIIERAMPDGYRLFLCDNFDAVMRSHGGLTVFRK